MARFIRKCQQPTITLGFTPFPFLRQGGHFCEWIIFISAYKPFFINENEKV